MGDYERYPGAFGDILGGAATPERPGPPKPPNPKCPECGGGYVDGMGVGLTVVHRQGCTREIDVLDDISHDMADLVTRLAAVRQKAKSHSLKRIEDGLARAEQRLRHTHDDVERLIYEEATDGR